MMILFIFYFMKHLYIAYSGKTRKSWWSIFKDLQDDSLALEALCLLSSQAVVSENCIECIESFLCKNYCSKCYTARDLKHIHWQYFCKKIGDSGKMPPTTAALKQHMLRAHGQAFIWGHATQPMIADIGQDGFVMEDGVLCPKTLDLRPAPDAILELVKSNFKSGTCSSGTNCSCRKNGLTCINLCECNSCSNEDIPLSEVNTEDDDLEEDNL